MFSRILLAASAPPHCDAAARVAFDLAVRYSAKLHIHHVIEGVRSSGAAERDAFRSASVALEQAFASKIRSGADCVITVSAGDPSTEMLARARQEGSTLVVAGVGAAGTENAGTALRGMAATSEIPLLAVPRLVNACWGGFSEVVFCADFSLPSKGAFAFACRLAQAPGTRLNVFHVLEEAALPGRVGVRAFDTMMVAARDRLRREYLDRIGEIEGVSADVWEGFPGVEIVKYARERQADLIVAAVAGHVGTDGGVGSTLESVLVRATCPVMMVRG